MGCRKILLQYSYCIAAWECRLGLELYCNTVIVFQTRRLGWWVVSQYSRSVLWLGKGLLGESRYKICIVTEAASLDGQRAASARGAQQAAGHGAGARARRGHSQSAQAGPRGAGAAAGARALKARVAWALGARPGHWARGLAKAVHSVHSACFWPGLTQYCS